MNKKIINAPPSDNEFPLKLKFPLSAFNKYTLSAIKFKNNENSKIGSIVLVDGGKEANYACANKAKGIFTVLSCENSEDESLEVD